MEGICAKFAPTAAELETLRRAGLALMYVLMHCPGDFERFMAESDAELTDAQRAELRDRYGIEE